MEGACGGVKALMEVLAEQELITRMSQSGGGGWVGRRGVVVDLACRGNSES